MALSYSECGECRGQKEYQEQTNKHTEDIMRHLVQDIFAEGCLKSFKMLMTTMDSQVWLSVWHFMDLLGPSRHLLHRLSLDDTPDADFYVAIASLGKRHRCFGQWTFVIMLC